MADNVKGVTILSEFLKGIQMLSDEQRGRLLLALFADSGCCEMPELDAMSRMVFELLIPSVRRFQDSYERKRQINSENGKKGGRPRKNTAYEESETETEKAVGFSEKSEKPTERNGTEWSGEKENTLSNSNSNQDTPHAPEHAQSKAFRRPTVEDVREYCEERQNTVDPQVFHDFYQAKGWRVGKAPMKDWKAAVRTWEQKQAHLHHVDPNGLRKRSMTVQEHNEEVFGRFRERYQGTGLF